MITKMNKKVAGLPPLLLFSSYIKILPRSIPRRSLLYYLIERRFGTVTGMDRPSYIANTQCLMEDTPAMENGADVGIKNYVILDSNK